MRLGIFGGSFDPVHQGHLMLADSCLNQAELDVVWFVPTACQPLKPSGPRASNGDRLAMLQIACAQRSEFVVSEIELERGGVSYTVDTLASIQEKHPNANLFFMMGADSLADLSNWHRPGEICELASLLVVKRPESSTPNFDLLTDLVSQERLHQMNNIVITMPLTPISSSEIREKVSADEDWQSMVPANVAQYIEANNLYR